jgi:hypothetical protein
MVWQELPTVDTIVVSEVEELLEALTQAQVFPRGIRPQCIKLGNNGLQCTSWRLDGFASLAPSALETSLACDLTVFCALCLLWVRSTASSFWDQLLPGLLLRASTLSQELPEMMTHDVADGYIPKDHTALELFWGELGGNYQERQRLQAAGIFPQPMLAPAFLDRE